MQFSEVFGKLRRCQAAMVDDFQTPQTVRQFRRKPTEEDFFVPPSFRLLASLSGPGTLELQHPPPPGITSAMRLLLCLATLAAYAGCAHDHDSHEEHHHHHSVKGEAKHVGHKIENGAKHVGHKLHDFFTGED